MIVIRIVRITAPGNIASWIQLTIRIKVYQVVITVSELLSIIVFLGANTLKAHFGSILFGLKHNKDIISIFLKINLKYNKLYFILFSKNLLRLLCVRVLFLGACKKLLGRIGRLLRLGNLRVDGVYREHLLY